MLILHIGYAWIGLFLVALGASIFEFGFTPENAIHLLTTGAMGTMTLAVMTRASLGHTGRPRHADRLTVTIYLLVNLGALLRIFAPNPDTPTASACLPLTSQTVRSAGAACKDRRRMAGKEAPAAFVDRRRAAGSPCGGLYRTCAVD